MLVWPQKQRAIRLPSEVEESYRNEFDEAQDVLALSPKASAALSRRLLQRLLREHASATERDLSKQIDSVLPTLPTSLAESVDAIRNIGNFAAHPNKSTHTGEIIDVEPNEAEWCLHILEELIGHYIVAPARRAAKRDGLNSKLASARKPSMK